MIRNTVTPTRYINQDVLAMRIDAAERVDRAERLEQERMAMEKVRGLGDKETKLYQRINQASQNDTAEKRRTEVGIKEKIKTEEEKQKRLLEEREQLETLLREQEYY